MTAWLNNQSTLKGYIVSHADPYLYRFMCIPGPVHACMVIFRDWYLCNAVAGSVVVHGDIDFGG